MTPAEIATSIESARDQISEAHQFVVLSKERSRPYVEGHVAAIQALATALAVLTDIIDELTKPLTDAEFHGLTLGEK